MEDKITHTLPSSSVSPEAVLVRLDAIIRELQDLRRTLVTQTSSTSIPEPTLTQRLSGSLAPSTHNSAREILEEYHAISDWERFV